MLQEPETLSLGSDLYLGHIAKLNLYFWDTPRSLGIIFWGRLSVKSIQITENSRFGDSCKQHFFGQYPMIFCGNSPQKSARSDQGTSRKYQIMLETCSAGKSYPRTNRVCHKTISLKSNCILRFSEQLRGRFQGGFTKSPKLKNNLSQAKKCDLITPCGKLVATGKMKLTPGKPLLWAIAKVLRLC